MKTIEQASLENSKNHYIMAFSEELHQDADMDFKAGVEFAQRWIPIEEEYPQFDVWVNIKKSDETIQAIKFSNIQLIKTLSKTFTHWRPITIE